MVSKAMMTTVLSAGIITLFTWLGVFVQGIFQDTASIMEQVTNGHTPAKVAIISDEDLNKLQSFPDEIAKLEGLGDILK